MAQTSRTISRITDEATLREIIGGGPTELVAAKIADRLNDVTRRFIDASPFVCVANSLTKPGFAMMLPLILLQ